jgi:bacteriocin biosynthesis cyclodehydratase domain-containing protein
MNEEAAVAIADAAYDPGPLVVGVGAFGRRVAASLSAANSGSVVVLDPTVPLDDLPVRGCTVYAGDANSAQLEVLDARAYRLGLAWLPVVLDHPYLRCGPFVVPGRGACHRCFERRRRQHPSEWSVSERSGGAAVSGFADHHVALAVALARRALRRDGPPRRYAPVYRVDMFGRSLGRAVVVPVNRCPRCRVRRDSAGRLDDLIAAVDGSGAAEVDR